MENIMRTLWYALAFLIFANALPTTAHADNLTCDTISEFKTFGDNGVENLTRVTRKQSASLVCSLMDEAVGIVHNQELTPDEKEKALRALYRQGFDVAEMVKYSTPLCAHAIDIKEIGDTVETFVVRQLVSQFQSYTSRSIRIGRIVIPSSPAEFFELLGEVMTNDGKSATVKWYLIQKGNAYKISDVVILSVSLTDEAKKEVSQKICNSR